MEQLSERPADPPSAPADQPRGRPRRALTAVAMLALLGAAAAGGAIGWQQRTVAADWRARATVLEQQRDDAVGRAEALSGQLGELAELVQLSVEDLVTIEERLAELAGEKGLAEDRATVTREELARARTDLRTLATAVEGAVSQLNACVDDLVALQSDTIQAFNDLARGRQVDIGPLNDRLRETNLRCDAARRAGAGAVALAASLR